MSYVDIDVKMTCILISLIILLEIISLSSTIRISVQAFTVTNNNVVSPLRTSTTTLVPIYFRLFLQQQSDAEGEEDLVLSSSSSRCITDSDVDFAPRELRFNMLKLIQIDTIDKQSMKLEALVSIYQACSYIAGQHQTKDNDDISIGEEIIRNDDNNLAPLRRFLCISAYAKDHQGNFQVANNSTTSSWSSLPPNVVFSQEQPFVFLRDSLSIQQQCQKPWGGMMYDLSESVVWCTVDSNFVNDELDFVSRVLDGMPFARLHLGSIGMVGDTNKYMIVELENDTIQILESMGVLLEDDESNSIDKVGTVCCKIYNDDLAIIETILGCCCNKDEKQHTEFFDDQANALQKRQQSTIIKMIDLAVDHVRNDPLNKNNQPHLVLISHSISASAVSTAISAWKYNQIHQNHHPIQRVEDLLNQALTVVTLGNVCKSFCDGPAYIHLSMHDDPWTTNLGSHQRINDNKEDAPGGRDAVYFHACSPYEYDTVRWERKQRTVSLKSHNSHNLNACNIQYLYLIMRINGIQSFRGLYDAARFVDPVSILDINPKYFAVHCNHGDLVMPPHLDDELLPAMIRATGGDQWIWKFVDDEDEVEVESLLPDEIETRSHLEESFGYNVLEEIHAAMSMPH